MFDLNLEKIRSDLASLRAVGRASGRSSIGTSIDSLVKSIETELGKIELGKEQQPLTHAQTPTLHELADAYYGN